MIVLGVDPGLADLGWGVIESNKGQHRHLAHGVLKTKADAAPGARLLLLYDGLIKILQEFKPAQAGIESLFFTKNITSALPVAQARGIALLAFAQNGITVGEYSPPQIKQSLVGIGNADKAQVQEMVRILLKLPQIPKPDHAADALAAAVCHVHRAGFSQILAGIK